MRTLIMVLVIGCLGMSGCAPSRQNFGDHTSDSGSDYSY